MTNSWKHWVGRVALGYLLVGVATVVIFHMTGVMSLEYATPVLVVYTIVAWPYMILFAIAMSGDH